jgi:hypothetical protein
MTADTTRGLMTTPANPSNRAFWTFLFVTLVGPFIAALIVFLLTLGAGFTGTGPATLRGASADALMTRAAVWAMNSYVWAAIPAAIAGAVLGALVAWRGTFGLFEAALVGIVALFLALQVLSPPPAGHTLPLALIAGVASVFCRHVLVRARVLH